MASIRYIYKCSECKRESIEFDKIHVDLLKVTGCAFCGRDGTLVFNRTETKYD